MTASLRAHVEKMFAENIQTSERSADELAHDIAAAAEELWGALLHQGKILVCGNGASAADAERTAAALVNRFEMERPGLQCIALTSNSATLTAIANDYRFDEVYSRQVRTLGNEGDVLLAITTTGRSRNIPLAIEAAHERNMTVILLSGRDGGLAAEALTGRDLELRVPAWAIARIQEVHILILHCLCELIDHQIGGLDVE